MKGYTNISVMYFSYQYTNMENKNINHKHFIDVICYRCKLRNAEMIIKKAYFMNYDLIIVDVGELFIFFL